MGSYGAATRSFTLIHSSDHVTRKSSVHHSDNTGCIIKISSSLGHYLMCIVQVAFTILFPVWLTQGKESLNMIQLMSVAHQPFVSDGPVFHVGYS